MNIDIVYLTTIIAMLLVTISEIRKPRFEWGLYLFFMSLLAITALVYTYYEVLN